MKDARCIIPLTILAVVRVVVAMEFKATVGRCDTGADVDFFQCNGCAYIHTVPPKAVPPKETKLAGG
jgi:hypothetical protein